MQDTAQELMFGVLELLCTSYYVVSLRSMKKLQLFSSTRSRKRDTISHPPIGTIYQVRFTVIMQLLLEPAKDLIRKMLVKDANKRYTVDQCLAHPWLTAQARKAPLKDFRAQMIKFNAKSKLKKAMLAVVATVRVCS